MEVKLRLPAQARFAPAMRVCVNVFKEDGSRCCGPRGGIELADLLEAGLAARELDIELKRFGCLGMCTRGPSIMLYPGNSWLLRVQPGDVPEVLDIVERFIADLAALPPAARAGD
jgi:(2Fe-2S) ferredoxin